MKRITWDQGSPVLEEDIAASDPILAKLSATAFMDVAIAGIKAANSSTQAAAEAHFQEIIEAARDKSGDTDADKRVRYVHERYSKAATFNKDVVAGMLAMFAGAGLCTAGERTAILEAWVSP